MKNRPRPRASATNPRTALSRPTPADAAAEALIRRLRSLLGGRQDVEERRMFGGTAFLLNGHMVCGVQDAALVLRLGRDGAAAALARPHIRPMDFTGKPLASMVYVDPLGYRGEHDLRAWVEQAVGFARTLPPR